MFKSILTILTDQSHVRAQVIAAADFARSQRAHLDVLAIGVDMTPVGYGEFGTSMVVIQVGLERAEAQARDLASAARTVLDALDPDLSWSVDTQMLLGSGLADLIGSRARHADLVILPQPYGTDRKAESEVALECALFDGRAPVLMLANGSPSMLKPKTVVIGWNQSAGAMAAVRAAMPLLQAAKSVKIAVINPGVHDPERSDPGGMLCQYLSRHDVHADVAVLAKTLPKISDVLTRFITDQNADLLVMGAYGHSRLREALFGGATREMLDASTVPVLMAH